MDPDSGPDRQTLNNGKKHGRKIKLFARFFFKVRRDVCLKARVKQTYRLFGIHSSCGEITEDDLPEERGRGEGGAVGRPHR
jgi:hypothetical protein